MNKVQKAWGALATIVVAATCYFSGSSLMVSLASLTGIVFVVGVANSWKHANLYGSVFSGLLGYLSYQHGLYGNAVINAGVCLPLCLYGWYIWSSSSDGESVVSRSMSTSGRFYASGATILLMCGSILFSYFTGASLWMYDGVSTALPVIATVLLVRAYQEQWYAWIIYNALEVVMWFEISSISQEMVAILVMKVVFLLNSLIGFYQWVIKPAKENK